MDCGMALARQAPSQPAKRCWRCHVRHVRKPEASPRMTVLLNIKVNGGCWDWTGAWHGRYGQLNYEGQRFLAHRFSLLAFRQGYVIDQVGEPEIPPDLCAMHMCDRPPCVNPWHLEIGTQADNVRDMILKGRAAWQAEEEREAWLSVVTGTTLRYAQPYKPNERSR